MWDMTSVLSLFKLLTFTASAMSIFWREQSPSSELTSSCLKVLGITLSHCSLEDCLSGSASCWKNISAGLSTSSSSERLETNGESFIQTASWTGLPSSVSDFSFIFYIREN